MRHPLHFRQSSLWLTGILALLLGLCASGCAASGAQPLSQVRSPAATPTQRALRQNYVYLADDVLLDGSPQATQAHWGQTLSITWKSHAYNQSANPSPITLSLLVYGPFASPAEMVQR
ncbi:MAG TPA: hypothetical protein VGS80_22240, partial [Ktedonobacterales bacterium]|nr:hypothetical protein [Ktedonobacterales bacterium]